MLTGIVEKNLAYALNQSEVSREVLSSNGRDWDYWTKKATHQLKEVTPRRPSKIDGELFTIYQSKEGLKRISTNPEPIRNRIGVNHEIKNR